MDDSWTKRTLDVAYARGAPCPKESSRLEMSVSLRVLTASMRRRRTRLAVRGPAVGVRLRPKAAGGVGPPLHGGSASRRYYLYL